jgi:hypothetical protein
LPLPSCTDCTVPNHAKTPKTSTTARSPTHGQRRSHPGDRRAASTADLTSADVLTPGTLGHAHPAVIHPLRYRHHPGEVAAWRPP